MHTWDRADDLFSQQFPFRERVNPNAARQASQPCRDDGYKFGTTIRVHIFKKYTSDLRIPGFVPAWYLAGLAFRQIDLVQFLCLCIDKTCEEGIVTHKGHEDFKVAVALQIKDMRIANRFCVVNLIDDLTIMFE